MPSQKGVNRSALRAGIIGIVGLGLTIGLMVLMLRAAGTSTEIDVRLGDVDFRGIEADNLADEISKNGPVPFPDLVGGDRPIWVNHFGDDSSTGWFVFLAKVPTPTPPHLKPPCRSRSASQPGQGKPLLHEQLDTTLRKHALLTRSYANPKEDTVFVFAAYSDERKRRKKNLQKPQDNSEVEIVSLSIQHWGKNAIQKRK